MADRQYDTGGLADEKKLLDHFAGQAAAVLLGRCCSNSKDYQPDEEECAIIAEHAYKMAAALVKEKRRLDKDPRR